MSVRGKRTTRTAGAALAAMLATAACSGPAAAANWFEKNFYLSGPRFDDQLPACDNAWALTTI